MVDFATSKDDCSRCPRSPPNWLMELIVARVEFASQSIVVAVEIVSIYGFFNVVKRRASIMVIIDRFAMSLPGSIISAFVSTSSHMFIEQPVEAPA